MSIAAIKASVSSSPSRRLQPVRQSGPVDRFTPSADLDPTQLDPSTLSSAGMQVVKLGKVLAHASGLLPSVGVGLVGLGALALAVALAPPAVRVQQALDNVGKVPSYAATLYRLV